MMREYKCMHAHNYNVHAASMIAQLCLILTAGPDTDSSLVTELQ